MIRFHARKTIRLGPIRLRFTEHGYQGWSLHIWRWTWNPRTGRHTFDTPGPGSVTWTSRRRTR